MQVWLVLAFLLALSPLAVNAASAQTQQRGAQPPKAPPFAHQAEREKANENLLMVLGGTLGGPWIHMAQDIALTVTEGDSLRVLPVAGDGAKKNLRDVLLLRGVDLAITRLDVLNDVKASGEYGVNLDRRVAYITALSVDMLQVLARPEPSSLKDLNGKKVNVFPKGSVIPIVLKTLGVEIEEVNLSIPDGIQQMRTGEVHATACFCSVPIPAYAAVSSDLGFKLLELPYTAALEESFLPASLSSETYPDSDCKRIEGSDAWDPPPPGHLQLGARHRPLQKGREVRGRVLLAFGQAEAAASSPRLARRQHRCHRPGLAALRCCPAMA